jgi:hypothetical protein
MRSVVAISLLLMGCAANPLPEIRTVEVPRAVPVPCVDHVPQLPAPLGVVPADKSAALDLALAKLLEWEPYGIEADGKLKACAKLPPD